MTAPLPDAVGVVERLTKAASQAGMLLSDPPKPSPSMALFNEAATLIQSQAARIAELEAEKAEAIELIHEAIDDVEWGWENANNHGGMIDDTTWHKGRDFLARLSARQEGGAG